MWIWTNHIKAHRQNTTKLTPKIKSGHPFFDLKICNKNIMVLVKILILLIGLFKECFGARINLEGILPCLQAIKPLQELTIDEKTPAQKQALLAYIREPGEETRQNLQNILATNIKDFLGMHAWRVLARNQPEEGNGGQLHFKISQFFGIF